MHTAMPRCCGYAHPYGRMDGRAYRERIGNVLMNVLRNTGRAIPILDPSSATSWSPGESLRDCGRLYRAGPRARVRFSWGIRYTLIEPRLPDVANRRSSNPRRPLPPPSSAEHSFPRRKDKSAHCDADVVTPRVPALRSLPRRNNLVTQGY